MADRSTAFRAPRALVRKIDEYARKVERTTGIEVTRAAAAMALLKLGLRAVQPGARADAAHRRRGGVELLKTVATEPEK